MKRILAVLSSPLLYIVVLWFAGAACVSIGIALVAGHGWALVSAGAFLLFAAGYIVKGMSPNG